MEKKYTHEEMVKFCDEARQQASDIILDITLHELDSAARAMKKAYDQTNERDAAVALVLQQYPEIGRTILAAMWHGIDACAYFEG